MVDLKRMRMMVFNLKNMSWRGYFALALATFLFGIIILLMKRWKAKQLLRGFPTNIWYPKFFSYRYGENDKMPSSAITNVLKRMGKLKGPYGCYGTIYGISTPILHMAHPKPVRAVLHDLPPISASPPNNKVRRSSSIARSSGASKAPAYNHFFNFCGQGVFTADGDEWRAKRASVLHCLMLRKDNRIEMEAHRSARCLVEEFLSSSTKSSQNVVPVIQRATLGLIYNYLTHTGPAIPTESYLTAITHIRMILLAQSRSIWFLLPRWCYESFSCMYHREEKVLFPIRQLAASAIKHAKPDSPLGQLRNKDESHSSFQDILDEAITLLFAGQDTGAATISWTLHLLSLHPDVQNRLANEVRAASDFTKLPFLDAVLKESMRMYPVAPFVVRHLAQDVNVSEKVVLPKGSFACIWIYSLHRNPDIWKLDPDRFIPERWINGKLTKLELDSYMPFCSGPRNCLGQPIAHTWLRTILGTLIQSIEFIDDRLHVEKGTNRFKAEELYKELQAGFTVLPLGGLHLRVKPRQI
mmetsp:Transcript_26455/g.39138  ORF Transcript_26455/g.39138 Transcript_26455/m.39138 type:complete len:526 (-) Transcript_26455:80-1657(-)